MVAAIWNQTARVLVLGRSGRPTDAENPDADPERVDASPIHLDAVDHDRESRSMATAFPTNRLAPRELAPPLVRKKVIATRS